MVRSVLGLSLSCLSLGFLAACSGDPMPMARGYSSYEQPYKSAPGPEARDLGYAFSAVANKAVLADMRPVAKDLAEQLDRKLSFSVDTVHLVMPARTAFYNSFDYLIRDELMRRGYLMSTGPDAVEVVFTARPAKPCHKHNVVPKEDTFYIGLALGVSDDVPADLIGGYYAVPPYDYIPAGSLDISVPCPFTKASVENTPQPIGMTDDQR